MNRRTLGLLAIIVASVTVAAILQAVVFFAYENMFIANSPKQEEQPSPAGSSSCPGFRPADDSTAPIPVALWSGEIGVGAALPVRSDLPGKS